MIHRFSVRGPLAWVVAATFLHFTSFYYLFSTLPVYVLDLGGSTFQVGLVIGGLNVVSLAVRPLFGIWMDRAGRRSFLVFGAAIYVVAGLGYLAIRSIPALLALRLFHAIGLATFSTAAASLAGDLAPLRRRGTTMGVYGLAQAGALTVGPGLGEAARNALGNSGLFLVTALTALGALACALAVPTTVRTERGSRIRQGSPPQGSMLRRGGTPVWAQFAASIPYGTFLSFVAVVGKSRGLESVGAFFALMALSSLGVRLIAGRVYDALGLRVVLVPALLCVAFGMILLAITPRTALFMLAAVLTGAGTGAVHTVLLAHVVETSPTETRGTSVAVFTSCWELGAGGGAILMGRLAQEAGFAAMFAVASSFAVIGMGGLMFLRHNKDAVERRI